jgi:hypothetical protein
MPFPVDRRYVVETEAKLGVVFPSRFVERMLKVNGGEFQAGDDVWQLYPFRDSSDRKRLKRTCNDIVHETTFSRSCEGFPTEAVAIGGNGGGDQLVLLPDSERPGQLSERLFVWDHETGDISELPAGPEALAIEE